MRASAAELRLRAVPAPATLEEQARAVAEALRPCDLTNWQFSILMALTAAAARKLGAAEADDLRAALSVLSREPAPLRAL